MIRMCNCSSTNWKPWLIFLPFWSYFWPLLTFITPSDFHNPFHPWLLSPFRFILCIILAFNRHTSFLRHFLTYSGLFHSWLTWLFAKVCYISDTLLAMASLPSLVESFLARYFLWFILALSLGKFWSLLKIADFSYDGQHLSIYILAMVIQYYKPCLAFEVFNVTSHSYSRAHPHLCRSFVA